MVAHVMAGGGIFLLFDASIIFFDKTEQQLSTVSGNG